MTEKERLEETIKRYEYRIHHNLFVSNSYYDSPYAERKETLEKVNELKEKLNQING